MRWFAMRSFIVHLLPTFLILVGCARDRPIAESAAAKPATANCRLGESRGESGPHFVRARELYALGPSKANEIIAELELELIEHSENLDALELKATTQMGTEQLDAALATLDRHEAIASSTSTISPRAILLRARCLYYKGDCEAAKRKLEPFWGFFQRDAASKSRYDGLMGAIEAKLQKPD
jgi:hypothetical protein